jgi:hypothetical protein
MNLEMYQRQWFLIRPEGFLSFVPCVHSSQSLYQYRLKMQRLQSCNHSLCHADRDVRGGHSGDLVATLPFSFVEDVTINGITEAVTMTGQVLVAIEVETIQFNATGPISFGDATLSIAAFFFR